ncbi:MAG: hypothetical protein KDA57_21880 [Planctomycetales bacterium]|nr:hypothetical protein [Planctomycetales bacterium]
MAETRHRGLSAEDIQRLEEAASRLAHLVDRDCVCDWRDGVPTDDCTLCDYCQAQLAMQEIQKVLDSAHEGLHPDRLRSFPERIYAEQWQREQRRLAHLNSGFGLLELLLVPEGQKGVPHVSQRDAQVAATVIQWLGTNCGRAFVQQAERLIEEERNKLQSMGLYDIMYYGFSLNCEPYDLAHTIASRFISIQKHPVAVKLLAHTITQAIKYHEESIQQERQVVYDT